MNWSRRFRSRVELRVTLISTSRESRTTICRRSSISCLSASIAVQVYAMQGGMSTIIVRRTRPLYTSEPGCHHTQPKESSLMKVSCLQENLSRGLSTVARAVAPRSTLPVLSNILLATDGGRLRLSATNLELGISYWIGAKIEEEGSTTVPARTFVDLVNTLPNDTVSMALTIRNQSLNVRCGAFNNDIKCIDAQEFPPLPPADLEDGLTLPVDELKSMIHQVSFAASTDDARPVLTGVLFEIEGDQMTLAAADGFRLSVRTAQLASPQAMPIRAIIPARALTELARVLDGEEDMVHMLLPPNRGQVIFRAKDVEVVSQLIDGTFPDYRGIVPTNYATRSILPTSAFLKACKAAD
ncbi:MAG TPA: DNA polymerase III subunit beta, partial [Chloroflexi bacterium]|nr:DNA polymerase III subunit beta [Chloroflexota bacterium]